MSKLFHPDNIWDLRVTLNSKKFLIPEKIQGKANFQFSRSVVSDSLRPHESQHARPPCPSPTPGVHSDSRPLSQWCHPAMVRQTLTIWISLLIYYEIKEVSNETFTSRSGIICDFCMQTQAFQKMSCRHLEVGHYLPLNFISLISVLCLKQYLFNISSDK